jgi:hypothetical protein
MVITVARINPEKPKFSAAKQWILFKYVAGYLSEEGFSQA